MQGNTCEENQHASPPPFTLVTGEEREKDKFRSAVAFDIVTNYGDMLAKLAKM